MILEKVIDKGILKLSSRIQARRQLNEIRQSDSFGYSASPAEGYMRGIDFYSDAELPKIIGAAFYLFFINHGYFPNLMSPLGFDEKLLWSKFFRPLRVPESGNKLLTAAFIPDVVKQEISCPEIVWRSDSAQLPSNDMVAPGHYYLKSNHGSDRVQRVTYPLDRGERKMLEALCNKWLQKPYGLKNGEWWYNAFSRELFLEKEVTDPGCSLSWNYYVFRGEVLLLSIVRKATSGVEFNCFDHNYEAIDFGGKDQIQDLSFHKETACRLGRFASEIGQSFDFVRVDLFDGIDGDPFLNEVTFSPSNGNNKLSPDFDMYLGNRWTI